MRFRSIVMKESPMGDDENIENPDDCSTYSPDTRVGLSCDLSIFAVVIVEMRGVEAFFGKYLGILTSIRVLFILWMYKNGREIAQNNIKLK